VGHVPKHPSREPIERLFELSRDLLGTASLDGYFTLLDPAWQRSLGWRQIALIGQPFLELVHADDIEITMKALAQLRHSPLDDFGIGSASLTHPWCTDRRRK
jgi:PAS domain S-box-containing protein